jgi:hypothetical protein
MVHRVEEASCGMVVLGDCHNEIAKAISLWGFKFQLFNFPSINFLFSQVFIIERGLSSDQVVDVFFHLSAHYVFEQGNHEHMDM